jgi:hypothetical protein
VRSRLAWIGGALGGLAAARLLRRRRGATAPEAPEPEEATAPEAPDPRAEELRRKLDESRPIVQERDEFEGAETPVDVAEPSVEDRRRDAHERGRAAVDRMRGT